MQVFENQQVLNLLVKKECCTLSTLHLYKIRVLQRVYSDSEEIMEKQRTRGDVALETRNYQTELLYSEPFE